MSRQENLPLSELNAEFNRPIEIYDVALDTETLRFAATNDYVLWNTNTYTPLPIQRSPVRTSMELQVDELSIELENIDLAFSQKVIATDFIGRYLTIRKVFLDDLSGSIILFEGRMDEPTITERKFTVRVRSLLDALHHSMPRRVFSTLCNYQHYDASCTVSKTLFTNLVTETAIGSSTAATIVGSILGSNSYSDAYWAPLGTIKMLTGSNATLGREVVSHSNADMAVAVRVPFPFTVHSGDIFEVTRGCRKNVADCSSKYENYVNYGGYPTTPKHPLL